jgi:Na+/H+-dicarboxylate symporter
MGDPATAGRIGTKALIWFVCASLVSLLLGLLLVDLHPRISSPIWCPARSSRRSDNEIMQIVIFSLLLGVGCAALGEQACTIVHGKEELSHVSLKLTGYIMDLASMAAIVTTEGLGILVTYGKFIVEFYTGLVSLWCLLVLVGFGFFGRHISRLVSLVREPFLLAFSIASSDSSASSRQWVIRSTSTARGCTAPSQRCSSRRPATPHSPLLGKSQYCCCY